MDRTATGGERPRMDCTAAWARREGRPRAARECRAGPPWGAPALRVVSANGLYSRGVRGSGRRNAPCLNDAGGSGAQLPFRSPLSTRQRRCDASATPWPKRVPLASVALPTRFRHMLVLRLFSMLGFLEEKLCTGSSFLITTTHFLSSKRFKSRDMWSCVKFGLRLNETKASESVHWCLRLVSPPAVY